MTLKRKIRENSYDLHLYTKFIEEGYYDLSRNQIESFEIEKEKAAAEWIRLFELWQQKVDLANFLLILMPCLTLGLPLIANATTIALTYPFYIAFHVPVALNWFTNWGWRVYLGVSFAAFLVSEPLLWLYRARLYNYYK